MRIKNLIRGLMFVVRCATMLVSGFCAMDTANRAVTTEVVDIETIRLQLGAIGILKGCADENGIINLGKRMNELQIAIQILPVLQRIKMFELINKENPGLERASSKNLLQIGNIALTTPSGSSSSSTRAPIGPETPLSESEQLLGSRKRASSEPPRLVVESRQNTLRAKSDAIDLQSRPTKQQQNVILQEAAELRKIIEQLRDVIGDLTAKLDDNSRDEDINGRDDFLKFGPKKPAEYVIWDGPVSPVAKSDSIWNAENWAGLFETNKPSEGTSDNPLDTYSNFASKLTEEIVTICLLLPIIRVSSNLLPYFIGF